MSKLISSLVPAAALLLAAGTALSAGLIRPPAAEDPDTERARPDASAKADKAAAEKQPGEMPCRPPLPPGDLAAARAAELRAVAVWVQTPPPMGMGGNPPARNKMDAPLTPHQAGQEEGAVTVQFQVPRGFTTGDEGGVTLCHYLSSDKWTGTTRVGFEAVLTDKVRRDFARLGVTDLAAHFRGRTVTVRGTVASVIYLGPGIQRGTLTIDSLDQFVSVQ